MLILALNYSLTEITKTSIIKSQSKKNRKIEHKGINSYPRFNLSIKVNVPGKMSRSCFSIHRILEFKERFCGLTSVFSPSDVN